MLVKKSPKNFIFFEIKIKKIYRHQIKNIFSVPKHKIFYGKAEN
jgi:hypothetical protein